MARLRAVRRAVGAGLWAARGSKGAGRATDLGSESLEGSDQAPCSGSAGRGLPGRAGAGCHSGASWFMVSWRPTRAAARGGWGVLGLMGRT